MCKARVRTEVFLQRTGAELQQKIIGRRQDYSYAIWALDCR